MATTTTTTTAAAAAATADDGAALVREVLSENPPETRGVREEWKAQSGWHRKEDIHAKKDAKPLHDEDTSSSSSASSPQAAGGDMSESEELKALLQNKEDERAVRQHIHESLQKTGAEEETIGPSGDEVKDIASVPQEASSDPDPLSAPAQEESVRSRTRTREGSAGAGHARTRVVLPKSDSSFPSEVLDLPPSSSMALYFSPTGSSAPNLAVIVILLCAVVWFCILPRARRSSSSAFGACPPMLPLTVSHTKKR